MLQSACSAAAMQETLLEPPRRMRSTQRLECPPCG